MPQERHVTPDYRVATDVRNEAGAHMATVLVDWSGIDAVHLFEGPELSPADFATLVQPRPGADLR
jgi:hypothetical protein